MNNITHTKEGGVETRLEALVHRLKEHGCRMTHQRVAVLRILAGPHHLTAEQVFQQLHQDFPMMSLATVYKTISLLKDIGELVELDFGDGSSRFDASKPYSHPHLTCLRCHTVVDVEIQQINQLAQQVADSTRYRVLSQRVDFFGLCPECQTITL
jgi:Fur family peroxide stress response transcriptional regulator